MVALGVRGTGGTERRLQRAGLPDPLLVAGRPTYHDDVAGFVPTSILAAHLDRLPEKHRERFSAMVVAGVKLPLDYVRLNVSATRERRVAGGKPKTSVR